MTLVSADGLTAVCMSASPYCADKAAEHRSALYGPKLAHLRTIDRNMPRMQRFTIIHAHNVKKLFVFSFSFFNVLNGAGL